MRPMTREEVRGAIVNLDPAAKRVRLPARFDDVRWHRIDYLGWRDPSSPKRAYLVTEADDRARGCCCGRPRTTRRTVRGR